MDFRGRTLPCGILPLSVARSRLGLKQPQGLLLLLVLLGLCHCVLGRPLLKVVATPGQGSGSLVDGVLRCLLQLGPAPFGHRWHRRFQRGQVMVLEGLDVRVRQGLLHPNDGPATPTRLSGTQQFPIAKQQIWYQNIYWEVSNPMVPFLGNK